MNCSPSAAATSDTARCGASSPVRGCDRRQPATARMEDGPVRAIVFSSWASAGAAIHRRRRERAAAHGLGADRGLALLAALLRLADHQPGDLHAVVEGLEDGLGVLRGRAPLPRDRELPGRRGRSRPSCTRDFTNGASARTPASVASSAFAARVRKPRDKPRVERSVPYVLELLLKGTQFRRPRRGLSDVRPAQVGRVLRSNAFASSDAASAASAGLRAPTCASWIALW